MTTPYQGNPDNAPSSVTPVDDSLPPNATNFNTPIQGAFDLACHVRAIAGGMACGNWPVTPAQPVGSTTGIGTAVAWSVPQQAWLYSVSTSGPTPILVSRDCGRSWATLINTTSLTQPQSLLVSLGNGDTLVFSGQGSGNTVELVTAAGVQTGNFFVAFQSHQIVVDYFADSVPANPGAVQRHVFGYQQSGAAFTGIWYSQADGAAVGTWTNNSASLPAAFASSAGNHCGQWLVANTTNGRRQAAAGDVEVVALCGVTPGTDTPHLMKIASNGGGVVATITDITANLPAGSYRIAGLAWDEINLLWGLLVATANGAGGPLKLYSSPDLVVWTLVHTFAYGGNETCQTGSLATVNGTWAVWVGFNTTLSDQSGRVLYSWDVAQKGIASVWKSACLALEPNNVAYGNSFPVFRSNGSQLMAVQGANNTHPNLAAISLDAGIFLAGGSVYF